MGVSDSSPWRPVTGVGGGVRPGTLGPLGPEDKTLTLDNALSVRGDGPPQAAEDRSAGQPQLGCEADSLDLAGGAFGDFVENDDLPRSLEIG